MRSVGSHLGHGPRSCRRKRSVRASCAVSYSSRRFALRISSALSAARCRPLSRFASPFFFAFMLLLLVRFRILIPAPVRGRSVHDREQHHDPPPRRIEHCDGNPEEGSERDPVVRVALPVRNGPRAHGSTSCHPNHRLPIRIPIGVTSST